MCDIILATISTPTFIILYKWTQLFCKWIISILLDSIVSESTSLLTVAIFDDNDNGFMAALSITKNTKCRMQYYDAPPICKRSIERNGHLAHPSARGKISRTALAIAPAPRLYHPAPTGEHHPASARSVIEDNHDAHFIQPYHNNNTSVIIHVTWLSSGRL